MNKKDKRRLLDEITLFCESKGYRRDSIWTFSNSGTAKYSSMTRENFLGFGCSATTMLKDSFKINTFSLEEYIKRVDSGEPPTSLTIRFSLRQRMVYYLFWTAYSTEVDPAAFEKFFGVPLKKCTARSFALPKNSDLSRKAAKYTKMTLKGVFYYHYYENFYTLSYIDKMRGTMRKCAFPPKMKL